MRSLTLDTVTKYFLKFRYAIQRLLKEFMILYLVHDSSNNTYSQPLIAPDFDVAHQGLTQLNPQNLHDLSLIPLTQFSTIPDLISLLQPLTLNLPDPINFRSDDSTLSSTPQPEGVSEPHAD